jgi:hypothetical protein
MALPLVSVNRRIHQVEALCSAATERPLIITNLTTGPVWMVLEQEIQLHIFKIEPFPLPAGGITIVYMNIRMRPMSDARGVTLQAHQSTLKFKLFCYATPEEVIADPGQCVEIQIVVNVPAGSPTDFDVEFKLTP